MSIRLMTEVWELGGLNASDKLVLLCLADHANDEGVCWPSMERVAKRSDMSQRSAQRICRKLEERGLLEVVEEGGGRGKTTVYRVTPKGDTADRVSEEKGDNLSPFVDGERVTSVTERVTSGAQKGDNHDRKGDIAVSPEPIEPKQQPTTEPSERQRHAAAREGEPAGETNASRRRRLAAPSADGDLTEVLKAWEAAQFKLSPVVQEHLRRWVADYGEAEVLEAIDIAGLDDPQYPGKYVSRVLKNRRADREAEEYLAEREEEARAASLEPREPAAPTPEEPVPIRTLREIDRLSEAEMTLDGVLVQVLVRDPLVAENRMRRAVDRTLVSAGLSQYRVEFIEGGLAA